MSRLEVPAMNETDFNDVVALIINQIISDIPDMSERKTLSVELDGHKGSHEAIITSLKRWVQLRATTARAAGIHVESNLQTDLINALATLCQESHEKMGNTKRDERLDLLSGAGAGASDDETSEGLTAETIVAKLREAFEHHLPAELKGISSESYCIVPDSVENEFVVGLNRLLPATFVTANAHNERQLVPGDFKPTGTGFVDTLMEYMGPADRSALARTCTFFNRAVNKDPDNRPKVVEFFVVHGGTRRIKIPLAIIDQLVEAKINTFDLYFEAIRGGYGWSVLSSLGFDRSNNRTLKPKTPEECISLSKEEIVLIRESLLQGTYTLFFYKDIESARLAAAHQMNSLVINGELTLSAVPIFHVKMCMPSSYCPMRQTHAGDWGRQVGFVQQKRISHDTFGINPGVFKAHKVDINILDVFAVQPGDLTASLTHQQLFDNLSAMTNTTLRLDADDSAGAGAGAGAGSAYAPTRRP